MLLTLYFTAMVLADLMIVELCLKPHWRVGMYLERPMHWYYYALWIVVQIPILWFLISAGHLKIAILIIIGAVLGIEDILYWFLRAPFHWAMRRYILSEDMVELLPAFIGWRKPDTSDPFMEVSWFYIPEHFPWLTKFAGLTNRVLLWLSYPDRVVNTRGVTFGLIIYLIIILLVGV